MAGKSDKTDKMEARKELLKLIVGANSVDALDGEPLAEFTKSLSEDNQRLIHFYKMETPYQSVEKLLDRDRPPKWMKWVDVGKLKKNNDDMMQWRRKLGPEVNSLFDPFQDRCKKELDEIVVVLKNKRTLPKIIP